MSLWRQLTYGLRSLVNRAKHDRDVADEVEEYFEEAAAAWRSRGLSAQDARRAARLEAGNMAVIKERVNSYGWENAARTFFGDLRFAGRQLRKSPGFTLIAVLTLALGVGALTTVATWTNAVLYNPWPHVTAPRELRFIDATVLGNNGYSVQYDQYRFLRESGRSWQDAVAFAMTSVNLSEQGAQAQAITAGVVSSNYFQFLGIRPQSGRLFQPNTNDLAYGTNDEIVLSDALWRDRFNANPSVVGRTISIGSHAFTVVGIAPADFAGIFGGVAEAAWIPLSGLRDLSADSAPDPLLHYGLQVAVRERTTLQPQPRFTRWPVPLPFSIPAATCADGI
jgi:hypothetical protein